MKPSTISTANTTCTTNSNYPSSTINPTTAPSSVHSVSSASSVNSPTKTTPGFAILLISLSLSLVAVYTKLQYKP